MERIYPRHTCLLRRNSAGEAGAVRTVILLSGGADSAVLLAEAIEKQGTENIFALSFSYGARHGGRELNAAVRLAKHYGVKSRCLVLPVLWGPETSALLAGGPEV